MIAFFDVISFFGIGSLFAWLAFAPLQSDQLENFKGRNRKPARENFATLNDHFFASFVFFSISAGSDYLFHNSTFPFYHYSPLTLGIGGGFLAGIVTLLAPMFYMRSIMKGDKTWVSINPPDWKRVVGVSSWTGIMGYASIQLSYPPTPAIVGLFYFFGTFFVLVGGWRMLEYWADKEMTYSGFIYTLFPAWVYLAIRIATVFFPK